MTLRRRARACFRDAGGICEAPCWPLPRRPPTWLSPRPTVTPAPTSLHLALRSHPRSGRGEAPRGRSTNSALNGGERNHPTDKLWIQKEFGNSNTRGNTDELPRHSPQGSAPATHPVGSASGWCTAVPRSGEGGHSVGSEFMMPRGSRS